AFVVELPNVGEMGILQLVEFFGAHLRRIRRAAEKDHEEARGLRGFLSEERSGQQEQEQESRDRFAHGAYFTVRVSSVEFLVSRETQILRFAVGPPLRGSDGTSPVSTKSIFPVRSICLLATCKLLLAVIHRRRCGSGRPCRRRRRRWIPGRSVGLRRA